MAQSIEETLKSVLKNAIKKKCVSFSVMQNFSIQPRKKVDNGRTELNGEDNQQIVQKRLSVQTQKAQRLH